MLEKVEKAKNARDDRKELFEFLGQRSAGRGGRYVNSVGRGSVLLLSYYKARQEGSSQKKETTRSTRERVSGG